MPCAIHTGEPGDDGGVRSPEGWEDASPVQTAGRTYRPYVQSAVREDRQGGAGQEEGDREAWRRERRERRGEEREERRRALRKGTKERAGERQGAGSCGKVEGPATPRRGGKGLLLCGVSRATSSNGGGR
jgi:hypothetical protein